MRTIIFPIPASTGTSGPFVTKWWTFAWVWIVIASPVFAQSQAPKVSLISRFDSPRSHAPVQFEASVSWNSPQVLEGSLVLDFYVAQRRVHTWRSNDVVLSASEVVLPIMMPPMILPTEQTPLDIRAAFVTEDRVFTYPEEQDLPYWVDWKRMQVIGIVHPQSETTMSAEFRDDGRDTASPLSVFRLDSLLPHRDWSRHLASRTVPVDPEDAPSSGLEWMAFDLVIVTASGLQQMNDRQLRSLADWVQGGGLVCVSGKVARGSEQQIFLEQVSESTTLAPRIAFDSEGNLRTLERQEVNWISATPGVGRSLVMTDSVAQNDSRWQQAILELWRVRPDQRTTILETGALSLPDHKNYETNPNRPNYFPFAPDELAANGIRQVLMPERLEGVPLTTVATLLGLCLLVIGPVEYFVLSAIGKRRWTWIVFPTVALLFSGYTVRMAQSHMGETDAVRSLTIVDLDEQGQPVRESRFELFFAATEKDLVQNYKNTLVSALEYREAVEVDDLYYQSSSVRQRGVTEFLRTEPLTFQGRAPLDYTVERRVQQWKPQIVRTTRLGTDIEATVPSLRWAELTLDQLRDVRTQRQVLEDITSRSKNTRVWLMHGTEIVESASKGPDPESNLSNETLSGVCRSLSSQAETGIFDIVSHISPNGAGTLEDLAIWDSTDLSQWLLLILVEGESGDHHLYRLLMQESET
ncbi:MAG: hypothetical protein KDA80_22035 [Planctomycetaceae bacterium]|nr:hypothetical protein [Planctomycetaceae bacterium]